MTPLLNRLKEPSTWAGLATVTALTGLTLHPEQWEAISTFVIAAIALFEVFRPEK